MTVPGWGRLTPLQMFMLMLAGHDLRRPRMNPEAVSTDEARLKAMALGRSYLRGLTGQDFSYDLKRWHEYLLASNKAQYKHPYCWSAVRPAIEKALEDPDRLRLVELLKQEREKLSSEGLAVLIADALVEAAVLKKDQLRRAVDIAREEIEVRKALGDY